MPWYWATFDGDDFVVPRHARQPTPAEAAEGDEMDALFALRGRRDEALGAALDREVRRLLCEAPHV